MVYRALLVDLDGTLLDTLKDIADSVNAVLACLGFPRHEVGAYRYFVGEGMEVLAYKALPENHRSKQMISKTIAMINEEYSKRWTRNTLPFHGIPELLDSLTGWGIRMAVLSNKPHDFTRLMVAELLAKWHFEFVAGALPSVPRKPDPAAAVKIAEKMKLKPVEFIYLGDSAIDMKTATAAGMYPVGALWGFRSSDELLSGGAKMLIQQPSQLLNLVCKQLSN